MNKNMKNLCNFFLFFFLSLFSSSVLWSADRESLEKARLALQNKSIGEAATFYSEISYPSDAWLEKAEDFLRLKLLQHRNEEAWRLSQVLKKVGVDPSHKVSLEYYEALSASLAGICPLIFNVQDENWRHLLQAYAYRFPSRFLYGGEKEDPFLSAQEGVRLTYLDRSRLHSLQAIPKSRLEKKMACRLISGRFEERDLAEKYEFSHLKAFWEARAKLETQLLRKSTSVFLRLLILSEKLKKADLTENLLTYFETMGEGNWLLLSEQERMFLWQKLIHAQKIHFPLEASDPRMNLVQAFLLQGSDKDSSHWIAALPFEALPLEQKKKIVQKLLEKEVIAFRSELLFLNAVYDYYRGDLSACLAGLRRALIDEPLDDELSNRLVQLALTIFDEYQYDQTVLGLLEGSLPPNIWGVVSSRLIVSHALRGDKLGFYRLVQRKHNKSPARLSVELDFYEMILERKVSSLQKWLSSCLNSKGFITAPCLKNVRELSEGLLSLEPSQRNSFKPFFIRVADVLEKSALAAGDSAEKKEQIWALMSIYDPDFSSPYRRGVREILRGTVSLGSVNLRDKFDISGLFKWKKISFLPLRDLLVQPEEAYDRAWTIR